MAGINHFQMLGANGIGFPTYAHYIPMISPRPAQFFLGKNHMLFCLSVGKSLFLGWETPKINHHYIYVHIPSSRFSHRCGFYKFNPPFVSYIFLRETQLFSSTSPPSRLRLPDERPRPWGLSSWRIPSFIGSTIGFTTKLIIHDLDDCFPMTFCSKLHMKMAQSLGARATFPDNVVEVWSSNDDLINQKHGD